MKYKKYTILILSILFLILPLFGIKGNLIQNNGVLDSGNILFVVDVSKSINVVDFKDNNNNNNNNNKISRLDGIRKFVNNFLSNNSDNSFGLMIFAGEALELLPFTSDISLFKTIFSGVDEKNLSKSGTEFLDVFIGIIGFFSGEIDIGTVVIFTDGGDELNNNTLSLQGNIEKLEKQNIKIILVGVGSTAGGYIPIGIDKSGNIRYKIYSGKQVESKLNEIELKNIAKYGRNIDYFRYEDISYSNYLEKLIIKKTKKVNLIKVNDGKTLTRELVFISFILFILFLCLEYFGYRKKSAE